MNIYVRYIIKNHKRVIFERVPVKVYLSCHLIVCAVQCILYFDSVLCIVNNFNVHTVHMHCVRDYGLKMLI